MDIRYLLLGSAGLILSCILANPSFAEDGHPHPLSPGAVLGSTVYDEQDKGTASRRVELSTGDGRTLVHHIWIQCDRESLNNRSVNYRAFDLFSGAFSPAQLVQPASLLFCGYPELDVTGDNRAIVAGQQYDDVAYSYMRSWVFWDSAAAAGDFSFVTRPPDSIQYYAMRRNGHLMWPHIAYVEGPTDTVLHLVAEMDMTYYEPLPIYYVRRVGSDRDPAAYWEYPPKIVDTTYAWVVRDLAATDEGRVAIAWTANVPCPGDPDTLSGVVCADSLLWDNDLYLQISNDYGVTWLPRQNITNYSADPASGYRAHSEISTLFSESGELHVIWASASWPRVLPAPGEVSVSGGALFHWSEYSPTPHVVYDFGWNQTMCDGGWHALNIGDATLAECRGRLFVLFAQFNDFNAGLMDDCARHPRYPHGAAIPDLYVTVSPDAGLTWDTPRNITNSHTPDCDTVGGIGGPCAAESWPSMVPYGSSVYIDPGISGADIIVPPGSVDPGWYLDVQYIDDPSPDFVWYGDSYMQTATVRWFRLACVDPLLFPDLVIAPDTLRYPDYAPNCGEKIVPIVLRNFGNGPAEYTVTPVEETGPTGWLGASDFSGSVATGPSGCDTGFARINAGGMICDPGSVTHLSGRLRIDSNSPNSPQYVVIDMVVADTVYAPSTDTLSTACLSLAVRNDGGCGARGDVGISLDYLSAGECDPLASVYLEEASPIVAKLDLDTLVNWSAYSADYLSPHGLVPLTSSRSAAADYNHYQSLSATQDTSLIIATDWYAPLQPDSCRFLVQRMRLYPGDNAAHIVALGQLIDWDIPADTGVRNTSDTLAGMPLIYQSGAEYHQDPGACQDNDRRFGAVFPLGMYRVESELVPYAPDSARLWRGATTRANSAWCSHEPEGLDPDETTAALLTPGWSLYAPPAPESALVDLHTLVTCAADVLLQPAETLVVYTGFATVRDGDQAALRATADQAKTWYCDHLAPEESFCSCCRLRGDANHDGKCIVSDLTFLVAFLFKGGVPPVCMEEADANDDGTVKISDVTYIVFYLFRGGAMPPGC